MAFEFKPGKNTLTDGVVYGVNDTFAKYIIQNEDITDNVENLEIRDQWGRMMYNVAFDKNSTLTLTLIGSGTKPCEVGNAIAIDGGVISINATPAEGNYVVQSVTRTCVYNDTAKWQINATAYPHATPVDKTASPASPIVP